MGRIIKQKITVDDSDIQKGLNASFWHWCMKNPSICNMVPDLRTLILYEGEGKVTIDLRQFPASFVDEHFLSKPDNFTLSFVKKLETKIFSALTDLEIKEFLLHFTFKHFDISASRSIKYYMLTRTI
jgi:hypothetical protein